MKFTRSRNRVEVHARPGDRVIDFLNIQKRVFDLIGHDWSVAFVEGRIVFEAPAPRFEFEEVWDVNVYPGRGET